MSDKKVINLKKTNKKLRAKNKELREFIDYYHLFSKKCLDYVSEILKYPDAKYVRLDHFVHCIISDYSFEKYLKEEEGGEKFIGLGLASIKREGFPL